MADLLAIERGLRSAAAALAEQPEREDAGTAEQRHGLVQRLRAGAEIARQLLLE